MERVNLLFRSIVQKYLLIVSLHLSRQDDDNKEWAEKDKKIQFSFWI